MATATVETAQRLSPIQQNEVERVIESSFAARLRRLISGCSLAEYGGTPDKIARQIKKHNAGVAKTSETICDAYKSAGVAIEAALSAGNVANLATLVDECRVDRLTLLQTVVNHWVEAEELAGEHVAALVPLAEKADADAEIVVEKVKAELAAIGSGAADFLVNADDCPGTAEAQLDHFVRNRNRHTRVALSKSGDARAQLNAARDRARDIPDRLAQARKALRETAVASLGRIS